MQCPNCPFDSGSPGGWKRHMTMMHGGWSDEQLAEAGAFTLDASGARGNGKAAMSEAEGSHLMGEESFDSYASKLPSDASGLETETTEERQPTPEEDAQAERAFRRLQMPKKMRAEMRKLKKKISEDLPEFFFNRQAEKMEQPEWKLTKDEKDAISDSVNMVLEVLDIDFAIEPVAMTLTSIWWVIAYPVLVILGIFFLKQQEIMKKENPLGEEEAQA